MPHFTHSTQKYDQNGFAIPKGQGKLKAYIKANSSLLIFDSKSEYETYKRLLTEQEKGIISNLEIKKVFPLIEKRKWFNNVKQKWETIRALDYIADFTFIRDDKKIALDCKGWKIKKDKKTGKEKWSVYVDDIYKIKKKLFLNMYPDHIFEEC